MIHFEIFIIYWEFGNTCDYSRDVGFTYISFWRLEKRRSCRAKKKEESKPIVELFIIVVVYFHIEVFNIMLRTC